MRHGHGFRKLNVGSEHRRALMRNLATQLLLRERITTSTAKAKELRKFVEPLITKAKRGTPTAYNSVKGDIFLHSIVLPHLFGVLGQRYQNRQGGYTRLTRLGLNHRSEDECIVELVDSPNEFTKYYRSKLLNNYREQLTRISNFGQKDVQTPISFVYPFHKRVAIMEDPELGTKMKSQVETKLKEFVMKFKKKLESPKIEYFSNVSLTEKGPVYSGELLKAPPGLLMKGMELRKKKLVFHEKIVPEESLRLRKEIFRRTESYKNNASEKVKLDNSITMEAKIICKKNKNANFIEEIERITHERGFKNYHVKITAIERIELVAKKPAEALRTEDNEIKPIPKLTLGRHGKNRHLR